MRPLQHSFRDIAQPSYQWYLLCRAFNSRHKHCRKDITCGIPVLVGRLCVNPCLPGQIVERETNNPRAANNDHKGRIPKRTSRILRHPRLIPKSQRPEVLRVPHRHGKCSLPKMPSSTLKKKRSAVNVRDKGIISRCRMARQPSKRCL